MTIQAADPRSLFYRDKLFATSVNDLAFAHHPSQTLDEVIVGLELEDDVRVQLGVPKPTRVSDPAWLDEVRGMACCVCDALMVPAYARIENGRIEPNHTHTRGAGGGDDSVAPMCFYHHQLWHLVGRETFARKFGIDPRDVAARLWAEKQARAF